MKKSVIIGGIRYKKTYHIPMDLVTKNEFEIICLEAMENKDATDRLNRFGVPVEDKEKNVYITGSDITMQKFQDLGIDQIKTVVITA